MDTMLSNESQCRHQPRWIGCPKENFRQGRPGGFRLEAIVIHVMDGSFTAGESVFLDPSTHKSAHYGVSRSGVIHQYVEESNVAFHAGIVVNPTWALLKPRVNPNFYTLGIEHEGSRDQVWPVEQMEASAWLVGQIAARWGIALDREHVIRHHQIRASKTCPGTWLTDVQDLLKVVPRLGGSMKSTNDSVRILRNVRLRSRPDTGAPVVRMLLANSGVAVSGFVFGQRIEGNSCWYVDGQGNYFWAGASELPEPVSIPLRASAA